MKIAFIGIGDMGSEMVPHLMKEKQDVVVFDRDLKKLDEFKKKYPKAIIAKNLEEAIKSVELVITSVMSDDVLNCTLEVLKIQEL